MIFRGENVTLITFHFAIVSNLQKSLKNYTKNSWVFFIQIPQILTFATFVLIHYWRVSCRHAALLPLNTSVCNSQEQGHSLM